jgi:hypothetical protein
MRSLAQEAMHIDVKSASRCWLLQVIFMIFIILLAGINLLQVIYSEAHACEQQREANPQVISAANWSYQVSAQRICLSGDNFRYPRYYFDKEHLVGRRFLMHNGPTFRGGFK